MNRDKYKRIVSILNKDIGPKKIDSRTMSLFLKQLSLLLNSGISLHESLHIMKRQGPDKKVGRAIDLVIGGLERGVGVYDAFYMAKDYFSPLVLAFIKTGTKTGSLGKILRDLSDFIFEESKNKSTVKQAMTYPILVLIVSILVIIAILKFVMPSFIEIFNSSKLELPLPTRILLGLSKFFAEYGLIIFLIILLFILLYFYLRTDYKKRIKIDEFIFKFKPTREINRLRIEYQLTSIYYILRSGDIETIHSFDIMADSFKNTFVKANLRWVRDKINKGESLSTAFRKVGMFSPLLISMVEIGEETSSLDISMKKANDYFANEYIFKIKKITSLAEPVLIIVMGILVAFVVFSVSIPMFDSINGFTGV
ncbi:type II secretion system F family protein [uncultured Anaerococcus sp.]|uniref:type II secretion system F family protein n=1 Tax=uncultured Anaerococcus sp. TaxID=293428 RepID=UPI0028890C3E|nr:type II secretion system F family protein [uncultured Anaerococcus sp.]